MRPFFIVHLRGVQFALADAIITLGASARAAADSLPYTARVVAPGAAVRSGPGESFYPTDTLAQGDEVEVHRERLILYGCGDFLNDYEGISGHEEYRPELALMYLVTLAPDGALRELALRPLRLRRFRLERASPEDAAWLAGTLRRASGRDFERARLR